MWYFSYNMKKKEVKLLWSPRNGQVIPLIIDTLGSMTKTGWFVKIRLLS